MHSCLVADRRFAATEGCCDYVNGRTGACQLTQSPQGLRRPRIWTRHRRSLGEASPRESKMTHTDTRSSLASYFIVGMTYSDPARIPVGHREVTVFIRV